MDICVVKVTFDPIYAVRWMEAGRSFLYPLNKKLGGSHCWSGCFREREKYPAFAFLTLTNRKRHTIVVWFRLTSWKLWSSVTVIQTFFVIDMHVIVCHLELLEGEFAVMGAQNVKPSVRKPRTRWKNSNPMNFRCQ
jgi:hypothetical protein